MGMYNETVQYVQCVTVYSVTVYSTYCGVTTLDNKDRTSRAGTGRNRRNLFDDTEEDTSGSDDVTLDYKSGDGAYTSESDNVDQDSVADDRDNPVYPARIHPQ